MSEKNEKSNLYEALIEFNKQCPFIEKDKEVKVSTKLGSYKFKYATLDKILETVRPILCKNQLGFMQLISETHLQTIIYHASGESIESNTPIGQIPGKMQEYGSKLTYLKRYALSAILGLSTIDDDDGNLTDGNHVNEIFIPEHAFIIDIIANCNTPEQLKKIGKFIRSVNMIDKYTDLLTKKHNELNK